MVLLRRVLGDALRARRQAQRRTLREVSTAANVSLGYLSEIERGQKEASSELLAAICYALGAQLSELLRELSDTVELAELAEATPVGAAASSEAVSSEAASSGEATPAERPSLVQASSLADGSALTGGSSVGGGVPVTNLVGSGADRSGGRVAVAESLSVAVHRDGPLKTTLRATRAGASRGRREVVHAA